MFGFLEVLHNLMRWQRSVTQPENNEEVVRFCSMRDIEICRSMEKQEPSHCVYSAAVFLEKRKDDDYVCYTH